MDITTPNSKVAVNLLPQEVLLKRQQGSKSAAISKFSILFLVILAAVMGVILVLRVAQNVQLKSAEDRITQAESRLNELKDKELAVVSLKQRLATIKGLMGKDEKIKALFNLITALKPADVETSELAVDKSGVLSVTFSSPTLEAIQTLFLDLSSKEKNLNLIAKVDLEGLSLGKGGVYTFSLKVIP